MKANRKFVEDGEAVSAVIGVILMVAITVAIAATVYVYVSGMLGTGSTSTPTLSCTSEASTDKIIITSADSAISWSDITLTNDTTGALHAVYTSGGTVNSSSSPTGDVTAGDYIYVWGVSGNVKYTFKYDPTNALMGSWTVNV